MTCIRIPGGVLCVPNAFVSLEPYGAKVWCEMHSYLGPTFFRSENAIKPIEKPSRKTWKAFEAWQKSCREKAEADRASN
jgi:hypothetical protein